MSRAAKPNPGRPVLHMPDPFMSTEYKMRPLGPSAPSGIARL